MVVVDRFFQFSRGQVKLRNGSRSFAIKLQKQAEESHGMLNRLGWWWRCVGGLSVSPSTVATVRFHVYIILQQLKSVTTHSEAIVNMGTRKMIWRPPLMNDIFALVSKKI